MTDSKITKEEAIRYVNNLLDTFTGNSNPYRGVPHWQEAWTLLSSMDLAHVMTSDPAGISVLGGIYLGTVEDVAKMTQDEVRGQIEAWKSVEGWIEKRYANAN